MWGNYKGHTTVPACPVLVTYLFHEYQFRYHLVISMIIFSRSFSEFHAPHLFDTIVTLEVFVVPGANKHWLRSTIHHGPRSTNHHVSQVLPHSVERGWQYSIDYLHNIWWIMWFWSGFVFCQMLQLHLTIWLIMFSGSPTHSHSARPITSHIIVCIPYI